jgi:soluble lytic murein transglycosylase-like protein
MRLRSPLLACSLLIAAVSPALSNSNSPTGIAALESIVDRHAAMHGLPKDFARAVVRVESTWNPKLTGAVGEVGLMQIKFETARFLGYEGSRQALYEPATNVKWGMKYLAGAWKLAKGDKCGTVLRYQGGHGARTMTNAARHYCNKIRSFMTASN